MATSSSLMSHPMRSPMVTQMRIDNLKTRETSMMMSFKIMALPLDLLGSNSMLATRSIIRNITRSIIIIRNHPMR